MSKLCYQILLKLTHLSVKTQKSKRPVRFHEILLEIELSYNYTSKIKLGDNSCHLTTLWNFGNSSVSEKSWSYPAKIRWTSTELECWQM